MFRKASLSIGTSVLVVLVSLLVGTTASAASGHSNLAQPTSYTVTDLGELRL